MGVFQPMDARETELLLDYLVRDWKGPAYLRLTRQALPELFPKEAAFRPGKLLELFPVTRVARKTVLCIASGAGTAEAVEAARLLDESRSGVALWVWNAHSLKPFDAEAVRGLASGVDCVATIEDHSVIGGLGTAVAEALAETGGGTPPLVKFGVQDRFGESGDPRELFEQHGFSAARIAEKLSRLGVATLERD
jgi:transketolase